jgi:hypothetical protein
VLYCFSAKYEEALQILTDIQWPPINEDNNPAVLEGYRFILSLQAWIVKGTPVNNHELFILSVYC